MITAKQYSVTLLSMFFLNIASPSLGMMQSTGTTAALGTPSAQTPPPQIIYVQAPQQAAPHEPSALSTLLSNGHFQGLVLCAVGLGVVKYKFPTVWGWGGDILASVLNRGPLKRLNEQVHTLNDRVRAWGTIAKCELRMLCGIQTELATQKETLNAMQASINTIGQAQAGHAERLERMSSQMETLTKTTEELTRTTQAGNQDTHARLEELANDVTQIKKHVAEMYSAYKGASNNAPAAITDGAAPSSPDRSPSPTGGALLTDFPQLTFVSGAMRTPTGFAQNKTRSPVVTGWPVAGSNKLRFGHILSPYGLITHGISEKNN